MKGYGFGLKQTSELVFVDISMFKTEAFKDIDLWFESALEVPCKSYRILNRSSYKDFAELISFIEKILLIMRVLLQDIRVPVFDSAIIEDIELISAEEKKYRISLWIPIIRGYKRHNNMQWLKVAYNFLIEVVKNIDAKDRLEIVYQHFHHKHVLPELKMAEGGKSTIPILQAAWNLGVPFDYLDAGCYQLGWGSKSLLFDRSGNSQDSAIGARVSHRKDVSLQMMEAAGLPVPKGITIKISNIEFTSLDVLRKPLVIKPIDRDRGEGVFLNIKNETMFQAAINKAAKLTSIVRIEEQADGVCHRILVANGRIVFVVRRNPRNVVGDGISSVQQLIEFQNIRIRKLIPVKRLPEILIDDQLIEELMLTGYKLSSIPKFNEKVIVRSSQSAEWGGDPQELTAELHPDNVKMAVQAAKLFGLNCAGIDFISNDISKPWHMNRSVINEINYLPVIGRTHGYQRKGATKYLKMLFPELGKIPIEVFVGDNLYKAARERHKYLCENGCHAYFCAESIRLDYRSKEEYSKDNADTFDLVSQLRGIKKVQALIVHIDKDDSFLSHGLPFEYVTDVIVQPLRSLSKVQVDILSLLQLYLDGSTTVINEYN